MIKLSSFAITLLALLILPATSQSKSLVSQCFGTTSNGRVENTVKLPTKGKNFRSYSNLASALGRTYVHSLVKDIVIEAYVRLDEVKPEKVFKYAETGSEKGGPFPPHKTHQNGLSVDFMVPVINDKGHSRHLPTHALNRFGYDIEFDKDGRFGKLLIDYEAMAAHIVELHKASKKEGVDLWRVIFDPKLQPPLFETSHGDYLKKHIKFSTRPSWVRHDEHYHVDFDMPCSPLN